MRISIANQIGAATYLSTGPGGASGINSPEDIAAPLHLWADASDGSTITGSAPITAWNDKSSNSNNSDNIQGDPSIVAADLNGLDVVNLDGTDALRFLGDLDLDNYTYFIVWNYNNLPANGTFGPIIGNQGDSDHFLGSFTDGGGVNNYRNYINSSVNAVQGPTYIPAIANDWVTLCSYNDGSNAAIEENYWEVENSTTTASSVAGQLYLGQNGYGIKASGKVAELIVYEGQLSKADRDSVRDYLGNKWGHHPTTLAYRMKQSGAQRYEVINGVDSSTDKNCVVGAGQSNWVGTRDPSPSQEGTPPDATALPSGMQGAQTGRYVFNTATGAWEILEAGVNNLANPVTAHGTEISLMKGFYDFHADDVYLIKEGTGGTNLHTDWEPYVGYKWDDLADTVKEAAFKAGNTSGVNLVYQAFLWIQGESDGNNTTNANAYEANESAFVDAVRDLLGISDLLFVSSKVVASPAGTFPEFEIVNTAKANNAANLTNYEVIGQNYNYITETHDGVHWSSERYVKVGYEAAFTITSQTLPTLLSYSNLKANYDIDNSASITEAAGAVSAIDDSSLYENDATVAGGTLTLNVAGLNGKDFVEDNGAYLPFPAPAALNGTNKGITLFYAFRINSGSFDNAHAFGAEAHQKFSSNNNNTTFFNFAAGTIATNTNLMNGNNFSSFALFTFRYDGTNWSTRFNGVAERTNIVDSGTWNADDTTWGLLAGNDGTRPMDGDFAEYAFYDRALETSEMTAIEADLISKWGL